jgi:hypothetical protein
MSARTLPRDLARPLTIALITAAVVAVLALATAQYARLGAVLWMAGLPLCG